MTTVATFSITRDQIIISALKTVGYLGKGEVPDADDLADCTLQLNILLKHWNIKGYNNWLYRLLMFPLTAGAPSHNIGPGATWNTDRPQRIPQAFLRAPTGLQNDQPIMMVDRNAYMLFPNKTQVGQPNSAYYDPQLGVGVFYAWPVINLTGWQVGLNVQKPIFDISTSLGTDTFDVPQEWYAALDWNLAEMIKLKYGADRSVFPEIASKAASTLEAAADYTQEDAPITLQPYLQGGRR